MSTRPRAEPQRQGLGQPTDPAVELGAGRFGRLQGLIRVLERGMDLLDNAVKVPGTGIRIGLDPILGFLAPGVGDAVTGSMALVAVFLGVHYRVPTRIVALMVWNVLVDTLLGSMPLVGDLFDVAFRSNDRNLRLLRRYRQQETAPSSLGYWMGIASLSLVALACMLVPLLLVAWLANRLFA